MGHKRLARLFFNFAHLSRKLWNFKALHLERYTPFIAAPALIFSISSLGVDWRKRTLIMLTVLLIILILALLGALPSWPYSHAWGYYPSGGLGILLIIVIILMLL